MLDISSSTKKATCTNTSSTNSYLRSILNPISTYRGTSYIYPQKTSLGLIGECLMELGFDIAVNNTTNYENHILFNDYSDKVCMQLWNSAASAANISFLYPRHISVANGVSSLFNSGTSCYATIRMLGEGVGKTKTMLLLGGSSIPQLNNTYGLYFTDAKYLPTGEMKKAIIFIYSNAYTYYLFDSDWTFLPGFSSDLNTVATTNSNWYSLSVSNGYRSYVDPFTGYKMFQEQSNFPELTVASPNGIWEFPDMLYMPYGFADEASTAEDLKYNLTDSSIYTIGTKKYLCQRNNYSYFLFRVE